MFVLGEGDDSLITEDEPMSAQSLSITSRPKREQCKPSGWEEYMHK